MDWLSRRDVQATLTFLQSIYSCLDLDAFHAQVVSQVSKLIGAESTSWNELNPRLQRDEIVMSPPLEQIETVLPRAKQIFEHYMLEHPILTHVFKTRDSSALMISDFATRDQYHRLALYNECCRRIGIEYQIAVHLPATNLVFALSMHRKRPNYSERDRLILNLLRPHLVQAHENAKAFTGVRARLCKLSQTLEDLPDGVIILSPAGRVRLMTARANAMLARYFDHVPGQSQCVPNDLATWVRHRRRTAANSDALHPAHAPLVVEGNGARLIVRLVTTPDRTLLAMEERPTAPAPGHFRALGLTRREAEVLAWIVKGKTAAQIGALLGTSPRTVENQVDRIYRKLGVISRAAAVSKALSLVACIE